MYVAKSGEGLRNLKALEFEKWGWRLEPSSLREVYAYKKAIWHLHSASLSIRISEQSANND